MSRSPTRSSELERILSCGRAVCTMMLGFFGLVTSTAVTFFGCDSWAIHSTRRRSRVSWMAMPSPQLPKPSRGWWASSRIVGIGSHLSLGLTTAPMLSSAHMRRAVVLAGLLVALATAAAAQSRPLAVRLAIHTSLMGAPDVIAVRQGYFKQEGLDVEWRRFALGKEGRDAMIAGAIDLNATAPTPFLIGLDKGVPYVALGVNSLFCGSNHLVVLKSSDINSVAQLKGKRIGLPKGTRRAISRSRTSRMPRTACRAWWRRRWTWRRSAILSCPSPSTRA